MGARSTLHPWARTYDAFRVIRNAILRGIVNVGYGTVADFRAIPGTGPAITPENINDNNIGTYAILYPEHDFVEVIFEAYKRLDQYRYCGHHLHNQDGSYKLQYYDPLTDSWVDWVTGIPTRLHIWSPLTTLPPVITKKIRIYATAFDTGILTWTPSGWEPRTNHPSEWEIYSSGPRRIDDAIAALNDLAQSDILSDATPFAGADVGTIKSEIQHAIHGLSALETLVDDLETRLTAARAAKLDKIWAISKGTVADFRAGSTSGTAGMPEYINDNDVYSCASMNIVGKYVEIDLGELKKLDQYRYYGNAVHHEDGAYKIQFWDMFSGVWVDLVTDIPTRKASWSNQIPFHEVVTRYLRVVATAVDGYGENYACEWEVTHD